MILYIGDERLQAPLRGHLGHCRLAQRGRADTGCVPVLDTDALLQHAERWSRCDGTQQRLLRVFRGD